MFSDFCVHKNHSDNSKSKGKQTERERGGEIVCEFRRLSRFIMCEKNILSLFRTPFVLLALILKKTFVINSVYIHIGGHRI